ncbi:MAG: glutamine synthetase family protein [Hydrotalea sp.]|nr:glutamine synthetase family protein [Hydrotalea sp.]
MKKAEVAAWLEERKIDEVECSMPDLNGIMRGKIIPAKKFLEDYERGIRMPMEVLKETVNGEYIWDDEVIQDTDGDLQMVPDFSSLSLVPWYKNPTAQVVCDVVYPSDGKHNDKAGQELPFAPRSVLKHVLKLYDDMGLKPVVAPELEFYLVQKNLDPDLPLLTPESLTGRQDQSGQGYGIERLNNFDHVVDQLYNYSEKMDIDVDTIALESGPAQVEFNFNHGDPLSLADQVFMFKRMARQVGLEKGMFVTFMARPYENHTGSAMHLHQSVVDKVTGQNLFAELDGRNSRKLFYYIGGLRKYISHCFPMFAPNINSYRRITPYSDAPINTHWGLDNRTVGLRVPASEVKNRRVENRIIGADCNPYLAFAASLAAGLLGLRERVSPGRPTEGDAYKLAFSLPHNLQDAIYKMSHSKQMKSIIGEDFIALFSAVKLHEYNKFHRVISSWEREHLLLNI